ncbi:MAG: LLM class flavin-dependent oxidoreductase, partial [Alphaproteobacteria bacterium]|nr:LLM class flavin-dependent oxidoreductase [Alphaproteobacteria bacterium]
MPRSGRRWKHAGFESVWAPEHSHIPSTHKTPPAGGGELGRQYYNVMDPFVTLTAGSMATNSLKVATGVCLVIQRDASKLRNLSRRLIRSRGRFLFGFGGGWNRTRSRATAPC